MKVKFHNRVLCGLTAILLVFCLLPISSTLVRAADLPVEISYRLEDYSDRGQSTDPDGYIGEEFVADNPVGTMSCTPGGTFIPDIPQSPFKAENGNTYTLSSVTVAVPVQDPEETKPRQLFTEFDLSEKTPVSINENAIKRIYVYYKWTVTKGAGSDDDTPETGRPSFSVENFISGVSGAVAQNGYTLVPEKKADGTEVYTVTEDENGSKPGLTLVYDTSMDMRNLGIANLDFDAAGDLLPGDITFNEDELAWQLLVQSQKYILDSTVIDLYFKFDDRYIDINDIDLSNAYLDSELFSLRDKTANYEPDSFETVSLLSGDTITYIEDVPNSYTIDTAENTVIIHCRWDGDKAASHTTNEKYPDPMIYFNEVKVKITDDWGGADTITINNEGKVNGTVYTSNAIVGNPPINGGFETDTFILTVGEPSEPEEDEPSTIIPDTTPTISIRKVWVEDTEETRPDSIQVDIYHDEELYDTIEVEEKYRWRASYSIPERYENDDWWVQEADVPAGYEDYIDETRHNVFVITNTYTVEEEESSEESSETPAEPSQPSEYIPPESSEPSVEPSEPVSEPSEPSEPTLPQTGQLWWPVPVLLVAGAVIAAMGALKASRRGRR